MDSVSSPYISKVTIYNNVPSKEITDLYEGHRYEYVRDVEREILEMTAITGTSMNDYHHQDIMLAKENIQYVPDYIIRDEL